LKQEVFMKIFEWLHTENQNVLGVLDSQRPRGGAALKRNGVMIRWVNPKRRRNSRFGLEIRLRDSNEWILRWIYLQTCSYRKTYAFCLDQPHVVVLCSYEVILVNDMMFRCRSEWISLNILGDKIKKVNAQAVPIIHTGPWDSDRIPRPAYAVIIASPSRSKSWSASQTQVPCDQPEVKKAFRGNMKRKPTSKYPVADGVIWRLIKAA
jgi:hypothetical protein